MPYRYPSEFHRRVLDLLAAGRSVASLSKDLGVSDQTIYNWRRQDLIDRGVEPGPTSVEQAELRAARRRIRELETELAVTKRAIELLKGKVVSPKDAHLLPCFGAGIPDQTYRRRRRASTCGDRRRPTPRTQTKKVVAMSTALPYDFRADCPDPEPTPESSGVTLTAAELATETATGLDRAERILAVATALVTEYAPRPPPHC